MSERSLYSMRSVILSRLLDTTKLSDMVIASFGDGRNLIREGKMFIRDESKVANRVGVVRSCVSCQVAL